MEIPEIIFKNNFKGTLLTDEKFTQFVNFVKILHCQKLQYTVSALNIGVSGNLPLKDAPSRNPNSYQISRQH